MDAQRYEYPKNHWVVQFKMVDFMACELYITVVMYGCKSWIIKKAECRRIDAFELWCWRRLWRVLWDCKEIKPVNPKGNQSWIFTGRTDAEAPILQPPHAKNWLTGKRPWWRERLKASRKGEDRVWDGWIASSTQWTWVWAGSGSWWWTWKPGMLQSTGLQRVGHNWATELKWIMQ